MIRRLLVLVALVAAAAGCGSSSEKGATTTSTTVPTEQMSLTVFEVAGGALHARTVHVPKTQAVARAALDALGVNADVTIDAGTAKVDLDSATPEQTAEIVYTLTQFPTVHRVDVGGRTGLTRDDVLSFVPPILIEKPAANAQVSKTIAISGTASVFEATLVVEVRQSGKVVAKQTVTASEGAPGHGTFATTLQAVSSGAATIAAYAPSAADGTPQHEQDIPVTVR